MLAGLIMDKTEDEVKSILVAEADRIECIGFGECSQEVVSHNMMLIKTFACRMLRDSLSNVTLLL